MRCSTPGGSREEETLRNAFLREQNRKRFGTLPGKIIEKSSVERRRKPLESRSGSCGVLWLERPVTLHFWGESLDARIKNHWPQRWSPPSIRTTNISANLSGGNSPSKEEIEMRGTYSRSFSGGGGFFRGG